MVTWPAELQQLLALALTCLQQAYGLKTGPYACLPSHSWEFSKLISGIPDGSLGPPPSFSPYPVFPSFPGFRWISNLELGVGDREFKYNFRLLICCSVSLARMCVYCVYTHAHACLPPCNCCGTPRDDTKEAAGATRARDDGDYQPLPPV